MAILVAVVLVVLVAALVVCETAARAGKVIIIRIELGSNATKKGQSKQGRGFD